MKKTALITGASGGIGYEFAKIYAREGYDLVIVARSEGKLYSIKKEIEDEHKNKVYVFACDMSVEDAAYEVLDFTLENKIEIDVLVNNAGFGEYGHFAELDWQRQRNLLQVNIVALVQLTRCFLPLMIKRQSGKIINLSSVAAFFAGPEMPLYYASKAFVRSFSEAVFEEAKGSGVTVTAVCPSPTSTGFEKAADMKGSKMFTFIKPLTARKVAEQGFKACEKGKALVYCGFFTKLANIGSRLLPRSVTRRCAEKING